MARKRVPYALHWKKWGIPSQQPPWLPTTTSQAASPLIPSSKRSKAIDMRFYWIRDRVRQGQFKIYWSKGQTNRADYFSKHHPASHHQDIRSTYLFSSTNPTQNYFDCLADDGPHPHTAVDSNVAPGVGVLLAPGNPEGHCDYVTEHSTMTRYFVPGKCTPMGEEIPPHIHQKCPTGKGNP